MDPKEIELDSVKCVDFDHDRNNSGLFVDVERILRVRQNIGIFLTSWETISFSRTTQLHWVSFLPLPFSNCSSVRFLIFSTFPTTRITQQYNHMIDNTVWPHTHVSHVAAQTDTQHSSTVVVLHGKIARPNMVNAVKLSWIQWKFCRPANNADLLSAQCYALLFGMLLGCVRLSFWQKQYSAKDQFAVLLELYWAGKTAVLGDTPVPVPLCPPQISQGPTQATTEQRHGFKTNTRNL
jgi:hypothetical protein